MIWWTDSVHYKLVLNPLASIHQRLTFMIKSFLLRINTFMRVPGASLLVMGFVLGCGSSPEQASSVQKDASTFKDALMLYASFDEGFAADFAKGDPELYTAASWDIDADLAVVTENEDFVTRIPTEGREGGALRFSSDWNPVIFFKGQDNVSYESANWAGSFSFWLRIDPVNGLADGYSDPFIITDKNWDNASFYVDFTDVAPRHFRFAAFSDKSLWNPEGISWEDFPAADRPMIDIASYPFQADAWTHVVLTFEKINATDEESMVIGYLNGEAVGVLEKEGVTISWETERVLMALGRHYAGDFDELAVFNRALSPNEVKALYTFPLIDLL